MTWEVRAVDKTGALVSVVDGVDVQRVVDELNGRESATLSIPTLHADATYLDLFENEVQLWLDGDLYGWYAPAVLDASRQGSSDTLTVQCSSLFSYFHDVYVGGELPNHIVSPHLDAGLSAGYLTDSSGEVLTDEDDSPLTTSVDSTPVSWTITGNVEDAAIVVNNVEFWDIPKALQLNNGESGQDAYAYQRFTVPADLDAVPLVASAVVYIADGTSGAPAYGGPAYNERGLMIHRLDGATLKPVSKPQHARITDETPRNEWVRLQTPGVLPLAGEVIEVRLYAPAAWSVWRIVRVRDERSVSAADVDKTVAVSTLVEHAQDIDIGKYDHNIGTNVTALGQTIRQSWPWFRRDNIGAELERLADTFEFRMGFPDLTPGASVREVTVRPTVGSDLSATVTLSDADTSFNAWSLAMARTASANRVIRQGEGSGAGRDEWWTDDPTALNGRIREVFETGTPGEPWVRLRDNAVEQLGRMKVKPTPLRAQVNGSNAKMLRAGDTVAVNLTHGWASFVGDARVMRVELDGKALTAWVDLEAV